MSISNTNYKIKFCNNIKDKGMVTIEIKCDTSARPAASEVSLPYAAGITIVLSPIGIDAKHIAHLKKVSLKKALCGRNSAITKNSKGYANSLIAVVR